MLTINGLTLDINFKGGTRIMIETVSEVNPNEAATLIEEAIGKKVAASITNTYSADEEDEMVSMLRIDIAGNEPLTREEEEKVRQIVNDNFNVRLDSAKNETISVSPNIGWQTLQRYLFAVGVSVVLILLYVAWRFSVLSGFSAAVCAIIALVHDIGVMFGVYIIFGLPLNDIFIAAALTVVGYSVNDTVIIYDRIRENTGIMKKSDFRNIVNVSIHQSLCRSINTMATTLICLVVLFIFAVNSNIGSLKDFSFSLLVGVITGAYSSIFIASPLWLVWKERKQRALIK
ncbi:MAG: protein translocase subunit SecF [Clostridiaceae bacterium]|nr:protein translocase subunit SecF [Clostridiaceae bacterium]